MPDNSIFFILTAFRTLFQLFINLAPFKYNLINFQDWKQTGSKYN